MLLAVQLATLALGAASCPSNLANALATPAPVASQQLITVEAATARATYATARIWRRVDGCWISAGGPYTARVGRNGITKSKREGDGSTPAGMFAIGATMYGNSPNPGVTYPYVHLRCGATDRESYERLHQPASSCSHSRSSLARQAGAAADRGRYDELPKAPLTAGTKGGRRLPCLRRLPS